MDKTQPGFCFYKAFHLVKETDNKEVNKPTDQEYGLSHQEIKRGYIQIEWSKKALGEGLHLLHSLLRALDSLSLFSFLQISKLKWHTLMNSFSLFFTFIWLPYYSTLLLPLVYVAGQLAILMKIPHFSLVYGNLKSKLYSSFISCLQLCHTILENTV